MKFSLSQNKILIVIAGILILLSLNFYQKEVKNFFYSISSPIQKSLWQKGQGISGFFGDIFKIEDIEKENGELKIKIQKLLAENNSLKELKKENETLRNALDMGLEKKFKLVLAEITSKDISQDTLLINKGSADGISNGLAVITGQKVLVGKISEVYKNFSKVMLISNKKSSFNAQISGKDILGEIRGEGSFSIIFGRIPRENEIFRGDVAVTGVLGGVFPKGLLAGEIGEIKKSDTEPFQQAEISPFFDINKADKLFIILND